MTAEAEFERDFNFLESLGPPDQEGSQQAEAGDPTHTNEAAGDNGGAASDNEPNDGDDDQPSAFANDQPAEPSAAASSLGEEVMASPSPFPSRRSCATRDGDMPATVHAGWNDPTRLGTRAGPASKHAPVGRTQGSSFRLDEKGPSISTT